MADYNPSAIWRGVPAFEPNAALTGGMDCPDMAPIKALADRTEYLRAEVDEHKANEDPHVQYIRWPAVRTTANDGTGSDNSTLPISSGWLRNALASIFNSFGFACSLNPAGYVKFPSILGGWLVQWGITNTLTSGTESVVTYPIAFTAAPWCGIVTIFAVSAQVGAYTCATNVGGGATTTSMKVYAYGPGSANYNYLVIGR